VRYRLNKQIPLLLVVMLGVLMLLIGKPTEVHLHELHLLNSALFQVEIIMRHKATLQLHLVANLH